MRRPTAQLRNADACIWLTDNGVEPDEIVWIRPREPWMLDRAVVQPDPAVATTLAADVLEATAGACSVGEMFLRLEDKGVTLRIDRRRCPPWPALRRSAGGSSTGSAPSRTSSAWGVCAACAADDW